MQTNIKWFVWPDGGSSEFQQTLFELIRKDGHSSWQILQTRVLYERLRQAYVKERDIQLERMRKRKNDFKNNVQELNQQLLRIRKIIRQAPDQYEIMLEERQSILTEHRTTKMMTLESEGILPDTVITSEQRDLLYAQNEIYRKTLPWEEYALLTTELRNFLFQQKKKRLNLEDDLEFGQFIDSGNLISAQTYMRNRPRVIRLPDYIQVLCVKLGLVDISDHNERAQIFLNALKADNRKYQPNTLFRIFQVVRSLFFPESKAPNKNSFAETFEFFQTYRQPQTRYDNPEKMLKFLNYVENELKNETNRYRLPILMLAYTGLRAGELLQLEFKHIALLHSRQKEIVIKRKNSQTWKPIYTPKFIDFIDNDLYPFFLEDIKFYVDQREGYDSIQVFQMHQTTLASKMKEYYRLVNDGKVPYGFGTHSVRYFIATEMQKNTNAVYTEKDRLELARNVLDHQSTKVTQKYIKAQNFEKYTNKLIDLTKSNRLKIYSPQYDKLIRNKQRHKLGLAIKSMSSTGSATIGIKDTQSQNDDII